MAKNKVQAIPLTTIDAAGFDGMTFMSINPNGLPEACMLLRIINDSNVDVFIKYTGAVAQDYLRAGETLQLPLQSNAQPQNFLAEMPKGTVIQVLGVAGMGDVYLAGYYQDKS